MVTPNTVYDYDIAERSLTTLKVQEIPSVYEPPRFRTQRLMAKARDGASVPISLVHHEDTPLDGSAPTYLYAYGAYGHAISPSFSSARISLLRSEERRGPAGRDGRAPTRKCSRGSAARRPVASPVATGRPSGR